MSARRVAATAVISARRLPPATILMITDARISNSAGNGVCRMPATIIASTATSASFVHETTASQSKKPHAATTMPRRMLRIGRAEGDAPAARPSRRRPSEPDDGISLLVT